MEQGQQQEKWWCLIGSIWHAAKHYLLGAKPADSLKATLGGISPYIMWLERMGRFCICKIEACLISRSWKQVVMETCATQGFHVLPPIAQTVSLRRSKQIHKNIRNCCCLTGEVASTSLLPHSSVYQKLGMVWREWKGKHCTAIKNNYKELNVTGMYSLYI